MSSAVVEPFELLDESVLSRVAGGQGPGYNPADNGLGRVGPGTRWKWLGNYYTPEALRHDQQVRSGLRAGRSPLQAHWNALPTLPAAAASYFRARFNPGPQDMHLPD